MKLSAPHPRLIDVIVERLTPAEREAAQAAAVERYLERLDRNQWRDPVSGTIRPRRPAGRPRTGQMKGGPQYWRR